MPDTHKRHFVIAGTPVEAGPLEPGLHLVATPIGNLGDVSVRALSTLAAADAVYCEDTRITRRLLERYQIKTRLKTYHEHNARAVRPVIIDQLGNGARVALVSDAGVPLVSDPGYKLVREVIDQGLAVHAVPGPSAPLMALVLSGLPTDRFTFAGFLPHRAQARRAALSELAGSPTTLIVFETAPRIAATLGDVAELFGDPPVALTRELTKMHEEVIRGTASEVAAEVERRGGVKGEITLVIGAAAAAGDSDADIDRALEAALAEMSPGKAASELARRFGRPRRELYQRALALKAGSDADER